MSGHPHVTLDTSELPTSQTLKREKKNFPEPAIFVALSPCLQPLDQSLTLIIWPHDLALKAFFY